jgi:poly-beta-1,6-N-acetyl-D-glucosamine synthase
MMQANQAYVLITPARNEEKYIDLTIQSVIRQTMLPHKWVIVSDGSTDRTDDIVKSYLSHYSWIELVRMPEHRDRTFAAKVFCFRAGYARLAGTKYEIIGNLDADISFEEDYIEFLLSKFDQDPSLGVAGTPFFEESSGSYDYRFTNVEHVSGACQLFRRKCFEQIGGYSLIKGGGIDWVAVTTARMKGWKTRTYIEKKCLHHRTIGTGTGSVLSGWIKQGRKDYYLGGHPVWQLFRCFYQMFRRPFLIGGFALLYGFTAAFWDGTEKQVSQDLMEFHRGEQIARLRKALSGLPCWSDTDVLNGVKGGHG